MYLDVQTDCSSLCRSWKALSMGHALYPRNRMRLPLRAVREIGLGQVGWVMDKDGPSQDADDVRRAAEVLAGAWRPDPRGTLLMFKLWRTMPAAGCADILAALCPPCMGPVLRNVNEYLMKLP